MLEIVDNASSPALLKVIGIGGGGSNAVNRMIQSGLRDVEFWISNTDQQALDRSQCHNRIQIGRDTTKGLGAGGDPEIGRVSAEEDIAAIESFVSGADMIFITAGMGGGTGTGAAPVIARVAREQGILTVAIVTRPFAFEGKKRLSRAKRGLEALAEHVDTLITIPNQKLLEIVEPGTSFDDALLMADDVLFQATRGISDLIMGHGIINLDFADVRTVMRSRGNALLGSGSGSGERRAVDAARAAVSSPLLEDLSISGAEALLVNIQGGPGMGFHEAAEAAQFIADQVGEEADVFWGAVVDPTLEEEMRVTLVATGFPDLSASGERTRPATEVSQGSSPADDARSNGARVTVAAAAMDADPVGDAADSRYETADAELAPATDPAVAATSHHADRDRVQRSERSRHDNAEEDDPVLDLGVEMRRPSVRRRRIEAIQVVEEARSEPRPAPAREAASREERKLRRPATIGSAVGHRADPGGVSEARPRRHERPRSPETVSAKPIGYREPRPEPARREPSPVDALHGADPGLRHARWGQEESDDRSGKQRSERRNPLDVPTFLRKRMDD